MDKRIGFKSDIHFFLLLLKMMADILKFTDNPIIDESIEEYEYHEYEPITGTSLNLISEFVLNRKMCSRILARAT